MRRSRTGLSILLIVALLLTGGARWFAAHQRDELYRSIDPLRRPVARATQLNNLNSFSLGLVLGGLRGPLVMYLWMSSENQKNERQLEDMDTKLEMIRLLQGDFDSVLIFQTWNKAYNLSVQMASLSNKYSTILDALDYARRMDAERPDNLNITSTIAGLYFDKLGGSAEKRYYSDRVRQETMTERKGNQVGRGTLRHDQLLDAQGHLLAQYTTPDGRHPRPPGRAEWNDGSELQYLKPYDTPEAGGFPHGISPIALGYNYYKRAQVLQSNTKQKHLQLSEFVVDRQPATALRVWADEEWELGLRYETEAMGLKPGNDKLNMELPTARLGATDLKDPAKLKDALFDYDRAVRLCGDGLREYERSQGGGISAVYSSHKDTLLAMRAMTRADAAYLRLLTAPPDRRPELAQAAREAYQETLGRYYGIILKYWIEVEVAAVVYPIDSSTQPPQRYTKETIAPTRDDWKKPDPKQPGLDPELYPFVHARAATHILTPIWAGGKAGVDPHFDERFEYETYISRANQRLAQIALIESGKAPPSRTILGP